MNDPKIKCCDCKKQMVVVKRNNSVRMKPHSIRVTVKIDCPDGCKEQPQLTLRALKNETPSWENITKEAKKRS